MDLSKTLNKVGAISGLLVTFFSLAGHIIAEIDISPYDRADSIVKAFVEHTTQTLIGTYLLLLAAFFLIWFTAYVYNTLNSDHGENIWMQHLVSGGGIVTAAMLLLEAHFIQSSTLVQNYGNDASAAKALLILNYNWYLLVEAPALSAFVFGISFTGFQTKKLPKWLTIWGFLNGLFLLSPFLPGSGILLSMIWIGNLSVVLFKNEIIPAEKG